MEFTIIYKEELVDYFYIEAESEEDALQKFNEQMEAGEIDFRHMELVSSSMEAAADDDAYYEKLWDELEDVPFDEDEYGRLILAAPWRGFPARTRREDIWAWFAVRHSKGIHYLVYDREG